MAKKVLVLSLSLLLIVSLGAFGAKKPTKAVDEKMAERLERIERTGYADESIVSQYLTTPEPKMFFPATGDTAGYTYYDYQHDDIQRRQIAYDPTYDLTHITWMNLVGPEITNNRYIDYNAWDPVGGWLVAGGFHTTPAVQRAGYGGLDLLPDKREVLCYHRAQPEPNQWGTTISIEDVTPGLGEFHAYDIPDSVEGSTEMGYWPTMAIAKDTSSPAYIHITHAEGQTAGGVDKGLGYVRCYEKVNLTTVTCESPGWEAAVDITANTRYTPNKVPYRFATTRLGGTAIATSPVSEKVAIVYYQNYANTQTQNDLMYVESTNNGDDWMTAGSMTPIKLTDYQTEDEIRAYCDLAVVYDQQDELHIMWTTFPSTNANDVTLWHWSPSTGIRKAGFATASSDVDPGAWNLLIAKFTLGVWDHPHPDSSYLYFLFTKFQDGDISAGGFANGDLYVKGSTSGGLTWGPEINITNTNTNGCTAGNCLSSHWSSLAEVVDDNLHISYIEDKDAGAAVLGEGEPTNNAVRYLEYPRPPIPAVASMTYSPTQMTEPNRWAPSGGSTQETMEFDNSGTATLWVQISGPSWVTVSPSNFNIVEAGSTQEVGLTLNGAGYPDTFLVGSLRIISNHGSLGGAEVYVDTQWVTIHLAVGEAQFVEFYQLDFELELDPQFDFEYYAKSFMSNSEWGIVDFTFKGTTNVLYFNLCVNTSWQVQNIPVLSVDGDGVMQTQTFWFDLGNDGDINFLNYAYALTPYTLVSPPTGELLDTVYDKTAVFPSGVIGDFENWGDTGTWVPPTPGSMIGDFITEWCVNIGVPNQECGIMECVPAAVSNSLKYLNDRFDLKMNPDAISIEKMKEATNWGYKIVASSWSSLPDRVFDPYPEGLPDPLKLPFCWTWHDENAVPGQKNAWWEDKRDYMTAHGYPITTAYFGRDEIDKVFNELCNHCDIEMTVGLYTGGHAVALVALARLANDDWLMVFKDDADQKNDPGGLRTAPVVYDPNQEVFISGAFKDGMLLYFIEECTRGDINGDGECTISDVIYLINYLFKGGPPPRCHAAADTNCDSTVSVSDVVHLINYLFKGGPLPGC